MRQTATVLSQPGNEVTKVDFARGGGSWRTWIVHRRFHVLCSVQQRRLDNGCHSGNKYM